MIIQEVEDEGTLNDKARMGGARANQHDRGRSVDDVIDNKERIGGARAKQHDGGRSVNDVIDSCSYLDRMSPQRGSKRTRSRQRQCGESFPSRSGSTHVGLLFPLLVLLLSVLTANNPGAKAQTVGVDLCACQPAAYEFVFDFGLACTDSTVEGPGINASACVLNTETDQNVTDFRPVVVTRVLVLELNQNFEVIAQTPIVGDFMDGEMFRYTSVIAGDTADITPNDVPRGIQLSMAGRNAEEQDLVNFWLILYDNNCGFYPVLVEGQQIGWTGMVCILFLFHRDLFEQGT